jgi:predicted AlkP superfamily pyrophosphatase or phosphodiesterase
MKKILSRLLLVVLPLSASAQKKETAKVSRPKLVVGLVVDQMRWDYLYRYYERYGTEGFRRLLDKGFSCGQTFINYLPSYTAPGHTCIYTGSVPAIHGIAANDWVENSDGAHRYCTQDDTVMGIGGSQKAGRMSPGNMRTTTVTDELRLATNFRSRVYGIALKDRGAILPAGHLANGAYWYDDSTGNFISSSYYGNALPQWLQSFNRERWADTLISRNWHTLYPLNSYTNSLPDDNNYETVFKGEQQPVFPHRSVGKGYSAIRTMPAGNKLTLMAAKACIEGEELGQRGNTDFLCVSLSSTDYVGHAYAPNSVEVEDVYLRLDRDIASFLRYLDDAVGTGNYLFFLSADHGGAHNSQYMQDLGVPAGELQGAAMEKDLRQMLRNTFKSDSMLRAALNYQLSFDESYITRRKLDRVKIREAVLDFCNHYPGVAQAADLEQIEKAHLPLQIREAAINGYDPKRSGSILLLLEPAWYSHGGKGTTHGSWDPYDTHIPLLWYGWHVPQGESTKKVYMTDIAATIAAMLHIQMPNGCIGNVINWAE